MAECRDAAAGEQAQYPAAGGVISAGRDGRAGDCGAESERLATVSGNAIKYRRAKHRRHPRAHCPQQHTSAALADLELTTRRDMSSSAGDTKYRSASLTESVTDRGNVVDHFEPNGECTAFHEV